jgi:hypothetical protein
VVTQTLVRHPILEPVPLLKPTSLVVYQVLLHLHKRMPLGSFFRLLEEGGKTLVPAGKLLEVYAREQNREMLRDFYYSDDRRVESAVLSLDEASRMQVRLFI